MTSPILRWRKDKADLDDLVDLDVDDLTIPPPPAGADVSVAMFLRELPPESFDPKRCALVAASQATEASSNLLLYVLEGDLGLDGPFNVDVVEKLIEAAVCALEIEMRAADDFGGDRGRVYAAMRTYIEGWVG